MNSEERMKQVSARLREIGERLPSVSMSRDQASPEINTKGQQMSGTH
jgi:hypothetical protein